MRWNDDNDIVMELQTFKGKNTPPTTATITQRYDPSSDRIYSHNDSIEGSYVRVLKRSAKKAQPDVQAAPV